MDSKSDREVFLLDETVLPGFLYDAVSRKFSPSKDAKKIDTKDMPLRFTFDFWDKKRLNRSRESVYSKGDPWVKDFIQESDCNAVMVKGVKIQEKRGIGIPLDSEKHQVTSLFYKYYADMLVIFSQAIPEGCLEKFEEYLLGVVNNSTESFIPQAIRMSFKCAYIYPNYMEEGKRVMAMKYGLIEFCRILKEAPLSTRPVSSLIKAPCKTVAVVSYRKSNNALLEGLKDTSRNSEDETPQVHSKVNLTNTVCQKEYCPYVEKGRGHGTSQHFHNCGTNATVLGRDRGTMKGRGNAGCIICTGTEYSVRKGDEVNKISEENKSKESYYFQKGEILPFKCQSNLETPFAPKDNSFEVANTGIEKDVDEVGQRRSQKKNCNGECNLNHSSLHDEIKESNTSQDRHKKKDLAVREESPENPSKKDSNSKIGNGELRSFEKDYKISKDNADEIARKHGRAEAEHFSLSKINITKEELQIDKQSLSSQKDDHISVNDTSIDNHQKQSGSGNILQEQKSLHQGLSNDDTDESNILKAQATRKQNLEKKKQKHLISNFLNPKKTIKDACGLKRKYYGVMNNEHPEKVILLLGASGSGKTMLLNFIANYFQGKKTANDELIHVENTTPTSAITAYTFCSSLDEIPITIIDTPGLNDSSGAEIRDHVQSLKTFLANASSKGLEIHAIGFVAQAYLVRLTSSERLAMDYVSTIFGQSVSEHMITLVTFADNQVTPPVVEAMKNYGVNSKLFLKFNNSALNNTKSDKVDLDRAYWRVCWRNWRKCLKTLRDLPALGVNTMKAVQSEIYTETVIKSAETDLCAELKIFFTYFKKKNSISKEAFQLCEKIWELGAIVHRLRHAQNFASYTINNIIIKFSLEVCKALDISPEIYVSNLSLRPSGPLVISGSEIVRVMAPLYKFAKDFDSETISKSITEWAYCHGCNEEHKMKRYETTGVKKFIPAICPNIDVLALQCEQCKCPGGTHGVSSVKSPLHLSEILRHTQSCLKKALTQYCLPEFPIEEKIFLKFLNQYFYFKHETFIGDLLKMGN